MNIFRKLIILKHVKSLAFLTAFFSIAITGRYGANYGEISSSKPNKSWDNYQPAGMVLVPGGYFKFGGYGNSIKTKSEPLKTIGVASFYIDASPISNSQYKQFLDFAKKNPNGLKNNNSNATNEEDEEEEDDENENENEKSNTSKTDATENDDNESDDDNEDDETSDSQKIEENQGSNYLNVKYMGVVVSPNNKAWTTICFNKNSSLYKFLDAFANDYFNCEAYDSFPVVCVSHEAAKKFAEWRTDQLNQYRSKAGLTKVPAIRLATVEEYAFAQRGGASMPKYAFGGPSPRKPKGEMMMNSKLTRGVLGECGYMGPSPSGKFPPNKYGIYDMSGNVASWTATITKSNNGQDLVCSMGGSWCTFAYYAQVDTVYLSNGNPNPGIGIRCVMSKVGF